MNIEWTSLMRVSLEIARKRNSGGMTAQERSALAEQYGISEEILLRCERANAAYYTSILMKQWQQAKLEATLRMRELGKDHNDPEFLVVLDNAIERLHAATPENEITREKRAAWDALKAALDASPSASKK